MKTRVLITIMAIVAMIAESCSSTKNLSNTPSWSNDIYGTSANVATTEPNSNSNVSTSDLERLEKAYAYVAETDLSQVENDTVIYKSESTNPYNDILADTYEESYERRLKGLSDPFYGINTISVYYSDALWYALAYDPAFYNIIIMGNEVWVEPRYISSGFGWPRHNFSFGWGWGYSNWNYGWGWNYPYYGYGYDYYFGCPWNHYWNNPWYNPYYGDNGYYDHHHNHNHNYGGAVYGRTPISSTNSLASTRGNSSSNSTAARIRTEGTATSAARTRLTELTPTNNIATESSRPSVNTTTNGQNPPTTTVSRSKNEGNRLGISEPTRGGANTYNTTRSRNQQGNSSTSNVNSRNNNTNDSNSRPSGTTSTTTNRGSYNTPGKVYSPSSSTSKAKSNNNSGNSNSRSGYTPSKSSSRSSGNSVSRSSSSSSRSSSSSSRSSSSSSRSSGSSSSSSSRSNTSRR